MMLQAGHYDPEAIRNCAEKVAVHWQQLMLKMEDRLKLVNASVAFYKTSEQVHMHIRKWRRLTHLYAVISQIRMPRPRPGLQCVREPGAGIPTG